MGGQSLAHNWAFCSLSGVECATRELWMHMVPAHALGFAATLSALWCVLGSSDGDLLLGYLYIQSDSSWVQESFSHMKLAVQEINANAGVLPNHTLKYILADTLGTDTQALEGAMNLTSAGAVGIIGTGYSSALPFPAGYCSTIQMPIVSPGSTLVGLADKTRYPFLLRSIGNDALLLKALVAITAEFGWKRVAVLVNVNFEDGNSHVLRPSLLSLGISALALVYDDLIDVPSLARYAGILQLVARSGYRIIITYPKSVDIEHWDRESRAAGLRSTEHVWLMASMAFNMPEVVAATNVIVASEREAASSERAAFIQRWPHVSTRYNASVHGAYDPVSKLPFFGTNAHTLTVWDTDYALVGDGLPDTWGMYVYDTVWIYALALQELLTAGIDPHDGPALRRQLLSTRHAGITGEISFDQDTQDRVVPISFYMSRNGSTLYDFARPSEQLTLGSPKAGTWCIAGCIDLTLGVRAGLPWAAGPGREPTDGRDLDVSHSRAFVASSVPYGERLEVIVQVRDSFHAVPELANYSQLTLEYCEAETCLEWQQGVFLRSSVDAGGQLTLTLPRGLMGTTPGQTMELVVKYRDKPLSAGPHRIAIANPALPSCPHGKGYNLTQGMCEVCPAGSFQRDATCRPGLPCGCQQCAVGQYGAEAGLVLCSACVPGRFADTDGLTACRTCIAGRASSEVQASSPCNECIAGRFASEQGMTACRESPRGTFVPMAGALQVTLCSEGSFVSEAGATMCQTCLPGTAQGKTGQSDCHRCEKGTFAGEGARQCQPCPGDLTTQYMGAANVSECKCPKQTYTPLGSVSTCSACKEGMECRFGVSVEEFERLATDPNAGIPLLQPGHYSTPDRPMDVYRCRSVAACPGGPPGQCAQGRMGLVCAVCPEGSALQGDVCRACSVAMTTLLPMAAPVAAFGGAALLYYTANSPVRTNLNAALAASIVSGIMVTNAQVLGTMKSLAVPWPERASRALAIMELLLFDPGALQLECLSGHRATRRYLPRFLFPFLMIMVIWVLYGASKFLHLKTNFVKAWEFNKTINTIFTVLQIMFIAITGSVAIPFQCYTHPNGLQSLVSFPDVVCESGEHKALVAMAVLLLMMVVLPVFSVSVWATYRAYTGSKNSKKQSLHVVWFRFLFYRFRPDVWWWGVVFSTRQLLLAFASAVSPDDPSVQVVYVMTIFVVYLSLVCSFWPWKSHEMNLLDAMSACMLVLSFVAIVGSFLPSNSKGGWQEAAAMVLIGILGACCAVVLVLAVLAFLRGLRGEFGFFKPQDVTRLSEDVLKMATILGSLSNNGTLQLLGHMNAYDQYTLSKAISCIQAASMSTLWVSDNVAPRLSGISFNNSQDLQWAELLNQYGPPLPRSTEPPLLQSHESGSSDEDGKKRPRELPQTRVLQAHVSAACGELRCSGHNSDGISTSSSVDMQRDDLRQDGPPLPHSTGQ